MSGPLAYTTVVPASRTAGEVVAMLGEHGAHAVGLTYSDRKPNGVNFLLDTPAGRAAFALPVDSAGMLRVLSKTGNPAVRPKHRTPEHAERVAWRVVRQWLEAQLALVEAQLAKLDQVMLPYQVQDDGRSLYEVYVEGRQRALGAGGGST